MRHYVISETQSETQPETQTETQVETQSETQTKDRHESLRSAAHRIVVAQHHVMT